MSKNYTAAVFVIFDKWKRRDLLSNNTSWQKQTLNNAIQTEAYDMDVRDVIDIFRLLKTQRLDGCTLPYTSLK